MRMSDRPLLKRGLARRKPIWMYRYEHQIEQMKKTVEQLKDQLEESNLENQRLRALLKDSQIFTVPLTIIETQNEPRDPTVSPQFKLSI